MRTAWAKGLRERMVVVRHALKNALIPVVTLIGLAAADPGGAARSSSRRCSTCPAWGRCLSQSLSIRDYPMVSGINLFFATFILFNNLLIDLLYAYLDPRIRYQ